MGLVCCNLQYDPRWVHPASSFPWTGTAGVCHPAWLALVSQRILHISSPWIPLFCYHLDESWEWKAACLLCLGNRCFRWKLIFALLVPEWDPKEGKSWTPSSSVRSSDPLTNYLFTPNPQSDLHTLSRLTLWVSWVTELSVLAIRGYSAHQHAWDNLVSTATLNRQDPHSCLHYTEETGETGELPKAFSWHLDRQNSNPHLLRYEEVSTAKNNGMQEHMNVGTELKPDLLACVCTCMCMYVCMCICVYSML